MFKLVSKFKPQGDQPEAIRQLTEGVLAGHRYQTLLGVTGSGKTFTMANIIKNTGRPALIISHNKTLAAQLYAEFKEFFPANAVHYFVSYYDYYQPEAYIPQKDIYIEKDASINENLDRLRLATTSSLMSRSDVIIVASVSCIYGLGSPEDYAEMAIKVRKNDQISRNEILKKLVEIQYERNEVAFQRGNFRVRGETIDVYPSYEESAVRFILNQPQYNRGQTVVKNIFRIDPLTAEIITELDQGFIFPAKHFVMPPDKIDRAMESIKKELAGQLKKISASGKLVEAQRLSARTNYDIEMLQEVGYCKGIENYSRHLSGRLPGQRPDTLIDFFPKDFLTFVDESHVTIPQLHGMYHGDRARKETLVEYGFRLPSALDNRPMKFDEWEKAVKQVIFVSATPNQFEIQKSDGQIVQQIIRPTGLVDPLMTVKPSDGQVTDLLKEIIMRIKKKERVLVTTLTKRLAEDLSHYLKEKNIKSCYLHSEIDTIERSRILRDLRSGKFDVLVGINLLREGLDLPEVSLVAVLDADKEGFLRSTTSLIQTAGRTARHINGTVILYARQITRSMTEAIKETERRREIQLTYNKKHKITPKTIRKEIIKGIEEIVSARKVEEFALNFDPDQYQTNELISKLEQEMYAAAKSLEFERAAKLRNLLQELKEAPRLTRVKKHKIPNIK
ncbi:MAG: excinuclease ABC subunit UvrB [Planctomycetota bacterium]